MKRWFMLTVVLAAGVAAAAVWFYQSARDGFESAERRAIAAALEQTSLVRVERVAHFAGEKPYGIVFGWNEAEEPVIVWVGEESVHEVKASEGLAENDVLALLEARRGPLELIRLTPGVWQDVYVWEAFYKKEEEDGFRYFYDYFRFSDGALLDTYRLSKEE